MRMTNEIGRTPIQLIFMLALALSSGYATAQSPGWGGHPAPASEEAALPLMLAQTLATPAPRAVAVSRAGEVTPADGALLLRLARADRLLTTGLARLGSAVPPPSGKLTLSQAYQLALQNDATLRAARAAAAARFERVPQARSQLLPQVSATLSRFRNHLYSTTPGSTGQAAVTDRYFSSSRNLIVRQALFNPARQADLRQAYAQADESAATLEREVQNLAVRVATGYLQVLSAKDQLTLVLAQFKAFTTQLDAAQRRFEEGAGTRTDVDEAQARLDLSVAKELEARQAVDVAARQLQILVASPIGELGTVDPGRLVLLPLEPASVDTWTAAAEERSPEIRAARAQIETARQEYEKARAGHLPTVDAVAQWSISDSDNVTRINSRYDQKAVGIQVNVPIYSGGLTSSQARQAVAELERARESLEVVRRDLGLRVHREFRAVGEAILRIRALEQAVRSTSTAVESARRSFQAGSRTLVDILNAEEQRSTAVRDLAESRYLYLLSQVRLRALTGEADAAFIDQTSGWLVF